MGGGQLGVARDRVRGRRRRWRRSAPSAATCRRSRRSSSSTRTATSATRSRSTTLRERGRGRDAAELTERSRAVTRDQPYTIIYTSGTTGPPKGCVLSHGNYRDVVSMCEQRRGRPGGRRRLPVPAARALLRAADPARGRSTSARRWPTSAATRSRSSPSSPRSSRPTCRRSRASSRSSTRWSPPTATPSRSRAATQVGLKVRAAAGGGPGGAGRAAGALRRGRGEAVQERPRGVRRQPAPGDVGRRADRQGDPRVLLRLRRAGARGLRHDRDRDGVDGVDRRRLPLRLRRPGAARAWRSGSPTTARSCSRARTSSRATTRTTTRRSARSSTAGCTPATSAGRRGRLPVHHRPQEGHHHHGGRQEPDAGEPRERPQAVALDLPGRDARRPPALPGGADHARPRGDRALRARARPAGGPRGAGARSRR